MVRMTRPRISEIRVELGEPGKTFHSRLRRESAGKIGPRQDRTARHSRHSESSRQRLARMNISTAATARRPRRDETRATTSSSTASGAHRSILRDCMTDRSKRAPRQEGGRFLPPMSVSHTRDGSCDHQPFIALPPDKSEICPNARPAHARKPTARSSASSADKVSWGTPHHLFYGAYSIRQKVHFCGIRGQASNR